MHSVDPLADPQTYHLIMKSQECAVVSLHNHPSLSLVSLIDIRFFLCNIKGYQKAVRYFLSNCYKVGIIYEDR